MTTNMPDLTITFEWHYSFWITRGLTVWVWRYDIIGGEPPEVILGRRGNNSVGKVRILFAPSSATCELFMSA